MRAFQLSTCEFGNFETRKFAENFWILKGRERGGGVFQFECAGCRLGAGAGAAWSNGGAPQESEFAGDLKSGSGLRF